MNLLAATKLVAFFEKSKSVSNRYLFYWLGHRRSDLVALSVGGGQPNLSQQDLRNEKVFCPDLATQRRIADFLDRETARLDLLIEKKQRLVVLLGERTKAFFNQVLSRGFANQDFLHCGFAWLNHLPRNWTLTKLKYLGRSGDRTTQMGPFGGMLTDLSSENTGYKLYGQENTISQNFKKGRRWLSQKKFVELEKYELLPGDLILTRKGTLGKCAVFPKGADRGIADSDTIRLRVDNNQLSPWMLENALQHASYISGQLDLKKRGAILSGLNTAVIDNMYIAVPPMDEQKEIEAQSLPILDRLSRLTDLQTKSIESVRPSVYE